MKRIVMALFVVVSTLLTLPATSAGQAPAQVVGKATDPFAALSFLEATWEANTHGAEGVKSTGTYTFRRELGGHILARRSVTAAACAGPADFDCGHGDMLYVYEDAPGMPLKAIYFDNEGHVIHYDVTTPNATTVVFLSEAGRGPQFRLTYELKDAQVYGRFQMHMPGPGEWRSYLEWSGGKK